MLSTLKKEKMSNIIRVKGKGVKRFFCRHTHRLELIDLGNGKEYKYQSICTKCGDGNYAIYNYPGINNETRTR